AVPCRLPWYGGSGWTARVSRNRRRSSGSPRTRPRSSGANTVARTTPRRSRALGTGAPFTRPRTPVPRRSSRSTSSRRPARPTAQRITADAAPARAHSHGQPSGRGRARHTAERITADAAPARIRAASCPTRCEPSVARYPIASSRFVLPTPLGPTSTDPPPGRATATLSWFRKSTTSTRSRRMPRPRPAQPGASRGTRGLSSRQPDRHQQVHEPQGVVAVDQGGLEAVADLDDGLVVVHGRDPVAQVDGVEGDGEALAPVLGLPGGRPPAAAP